MSLMDKIKVVMASVAPLDLLMADLVAELEQKYRLHVDIELYSLHESGELAVDRRDLSKDLKSADFVLLDLMGAQEGLTDFICSVLAETDNAVIPTGYMPPVIMQTARMGSFSLDDSIASVKKMMMKQSQGEPDQKSQMMSQMMDISKMLGMLVAFLPPDKQRDAQNWVLAFNYWNNGGRENLKNLFLLLAGNCKGLSVPEPDPPQELPDVGIYHPEDEKVFDSLKDYLAAYPLDEKKPTVGIIMYMGRYGEASQAGARALFNRLAAECNVIQTFFYTASNQRFDKLKGFFYYKDKPLVDALVNMSSFRLNVGPRGGDSGSTIADLKKLNVPVFHPVPMNRKKISDWREEESLMPNEVIINVILPELDGCIEPIPISGLQSHGYDEVRGVDMQGAAPIEERVDKIARRVLSWLRLRNKPNVEKKVAFILYNYPPGEDNIGGAAYLDVFASMKKLLGELREAGYNTGDLPEGKLHQLFLDQGIVNSGKWLPGS